MCDIEDTHDMTLITQIKCSCAPLRYSRYSSQPVHINAEKKREIKN